MRFILILLVVLAIIAILIVLNVINNKKEKLDAGGRKKACKLTLDEYNLIVSGNIEELVYETIIPRNVRIPEAPSHGKPVMLYDFRSVGAQSYIKLAAEILKREKGENNG